MKRWLSACLCLVLVACNLPVSAPTAGPDDLPVTQPEGQPTAEVPARIVNLVGGELTGSLDDQGMPQVEVIVEVEDARDIWLDAGAGHTVGYLTASDETSPLRAEFTWSPAAGGGKYNLFLTANLKDGTQLYKVFPVTVTGIPTLSLDLDQARQRIGAVYRDQYGLALTAFPLGKKERYGVISDPWVSVVYYNGTFYEVELLPNGSVVSYTYPYVDAANAPLSGEKDYFMCAPRGNFRILVVMVDFGNFNLSEAELAQKLEQATLELNREFQSYSGGFAPFITVEIEGRLIPRPVELDNGQGMVSIGTIEAATGLDLNAYDFVIQMDLDTQATYEQIVGTHGLQMEACRRPHTNVNIWMSASAPEEIEDLITVTLPHEMLHTFGYPATHSWYCMEGEVSDPYDECDMPANWPALMLGWRDLDGDGLPEINDPNPYGSP